MKEGRTFPDLHRRYLPILTWGAEYSPRTLASDLVTAAIVTIMLIPQSLAYALLVGQPPQIGLHASMAPLAVGPVAVALALGMLFASSTTRSGFTVPGNLL